MLILCNPVRSSIQNSLSLKLGKSSTSLIGTRTSVLTVLVGRCGLLEVRTILPACKNTLASALS